MKTDKKTSALEYFKTEAISRNRRFDYSLASLIAKLILSLPEKESSSLLHVVILQLFLASLSKLIWDVAGLSQFSKGTFLNMMVKIILLCLEKNYCFK